MAETREFSEKGFRWYDSDEPSLARSTEADYKVYAVQVVTDTVIDGSSVFAPGCDGDSSIFGETLVPGLYYLAFSKFVATSGTGLVYLM